MDKVDPDSEATAQTSDSGRSSVDKRPREDPHDVGQAAVLKQHESDLTALDAKDQSLRDQMSQLDMEYKRTKIAMEQNQCDIKEKRKWVHFEKWCQWLCEQGQQRRSSGGSGSHVATVGTIPSLAVQYVDDSTPNIPLWDTDCSMLPMGYAKRLGQILLAQQHCAPQEVLFTVSILLNLLLPASIGGTILKTDSALNQAALEYLSPLLQYIATSDKLNRVVFRSYPDSILYNKGWHSFLVLTILGAVSSNPLVKEVSFACPLCAHQLSYCRSLTVLTVDIASWYIRLDPILVAFQSLAYLASFTVSGIYKSNRILVPILNTVTSASRGLQELRFIAARSMAHDHTKMHLPPDFWEALAPIFHATTKLQHLELEGFQLRDSDAEGIVKCLKDPVGGGPSRTTISKLSLWKSEWDGMISNALLKFLQTISPAANGADASYSSLLELHGVPDGFEILDMFSSRDATNREIFPVAGLTIGSLLHTLSFQRFCIWRHTCPDLRHVRLRYLRVDEIEWDDCRSLHKFVPMVPSLRELFIGQWRFNEDPSWASRLLVEMAQKSQGLCMLSISKQKYHPLFDAAQLHQLEAYCQRNRFIIELTEKRPWNSADLHENTRGDCAAPAQSALRAVVTTVDVLLHPMLLQVAQQLSFQTMIRVVWALDLVSAGAASEETRHF